MLGAKSYVGPAKNRSFPELLFISLRSSVLANLKKNVSENVSYIHVATLVSLKFSQVLCRQSMDSEVIFGLQLESFKILGQFLSGAFHRLDTARKPHLIQDTITLHTRQDLEKSK